MIISPNTPIIECWSAFDSMVSNAGEYARKELAAEFNGLRPAVLLSPEGLRFSISWRATLGIHGPLKQYELPFTWSEFAMPEVVSLLAYKLVHYFVLWATNYGNPTRAANTKQKLLARVKHI